MISRTRAALVLTASLVVAEGCALLAGVGDDLGLTPNDAGADVTAPGDDGGGLDGSPPPPPRSLVLLAGALGGIGNLDGQGRDARVGEVRSLVFRDPGHIVFCDRTAAAIRELEIDTQTVRTLAGLGYAGERPVDTPDGDGGVLYAPSGIAFDGPRTIYFTDHRAIRRFDLISGELSTIAGQVLTAGFVDGPAADARFETLTAMALDRAGRILYVADTLQHRVRSLDLDTNVVATVAGTGEPEHVNGPDGGAFLHPTSVEVATGGARLYVGDATSIRSVDLATGAVAPVVGGPSRGNVDGDAGVALLGPVSGLAARANSSELYFADDNRRLRQVDTATRVASTVIGSPSQTGNVDGDAGVARFVRPWALATQGDLVAISDTVRYVIRVFDRTTGEVTTVGGAPPSLGAVDGPGADARFYTPYGLVRLNNGDLVVSDCSNGNLRRIDRAGVVSTYTGMLGVRGLSDGIEDSRFLCPYGIAHDPATDNILVADLTNNAIRRVLPTGRVETLFQDPTNTTPVRVDGPKAEAHIHRPHSVAFGPDGDVLFIEVNGPKIRRLDRNGDISTVVGSEPGYDDGVDGAVRLRLPRGIVGAGDGRYYFTDDGRVRMLTITGVAEARHYEVVTLVGKQTRGHKDGRGTEAELDHPELLALDGRGGLLVGDDVSHVVRRIDLATLDVTTIAGTPFRRGARLGPAPGILSSPAGIVAEPDGRIHIALPAEHSIVDLVP